jgi:hypothetical protein
MCMSCGAPETQAPTLMSHDGGGHCFFVRQPASKKETDAAILGALASCCCAVRYGGQDRDILIRFAELGEAQSCDYELDQEPEPANLSRAIFEFEKLEDSNAKRGHILRQIVEYLAKEVAPEPSRHSRIADFRCSENAASFRFEWAYSGNIRGNSATFELEPYGEHNWLLGISGQDHPTTWSAISVHKAMERDTRFRQIRWFSEDEWQRGHEAGRALPY